MNSAVELSAVEPENDLIRFEQPLTERMRTFLRVEFLYEQALFHFEDPTDFGARAAITGLLEMLTILGRGDVRADVMKELERHADLLAKYRSQPGVDPSRLTGLIASIAELRGRLADAGPHLMNPLKECDFLNTIRHRSAIPGGTCTFDLPDYGYWLTLPAAERRQQLEEWTERLKPLCDAIAEVLWLTERSDRGRRSCRPRRPLSTEFRPQRAGQSRPGSAPRRHRDLPGNQRRAAPVHGSLHALARRGNAPCAGDPRRTIFTRRLLIPRKGPPSPAAVHENLCARSVSPPGRRARMPR